MINLNQLSTLTTITFEPKPLPATLIGTQFFDSFFDPAAGKLYMGQGPYLWSDNPILQARFNAGANDFITDNGDGTFEVTLHTDFIRPGTTDNGSHVDDTTAANGLTGTVTTSGIQGSNRRTGGTANAIRTTQTRSVVFGSNDEETAPNHRTAYWGIWGDAIL